MVRLWLLSHLPRTKTNLLVLAAAERAGCELELIDPADLSIELHTSGAVLRRHGDAVVLPDLVYTRLGASAPEESLLVVRQLEILGVPCVNTSSALRRARNKVLTHQCLAQRGIPFPRTLFLSRRTSLEQIEQIIPGPPWIVKLSVGTQGNGVMLAESMRSLRAMCDTLFSAHLQVFIQEFVADANGADIRVWVFGGKAVAAVKRQARGDEFRSNVHLGGSDTAVPLTDVFADLAERAASTMQLDFAGVDLAETSAGPIVLEVNGAPGMATGQKLGLSDMAVSFLRERALAGRRQSPASDRPGRL